MRWIKTKYTKDEGKTRETGKGNWRNQKKNKESEEENQKLKNQIINQEDEKEIIKDKKIEGEEQGNKWSSYKSSEI